MDTIHLNQKNGKQLTVNVSSCLIEDIQPTPILGAGTEMKGIFGNEATPVFFSISKDQQLHMLTFETTNGSGWNFTSLNQRLNISGALTSYDVQQINNDQFRLAFTTFENNVYRLYYFDQVQRDLSNLSPITYQLNTTPHQIHFNTNTKSGDFMLSQDKNGQNVCTRFWLENEVLQEKPLYLPRNLAPNELMDLSYGYITAKKAVFMAYHLQDEIEVVGIRGEGVTTSFSDLIPDKIQCIQTVHNVFSDPDTPKTHLFLGGEKGVYFYENASTSIGPKTVTNDMAEVNEILAFQSTTKTMLWVKTVNNQLYLIEGETNTNGEITWKTPILFMSNILSLAQTSGQSIGKNQLFVLTDTWQLITIWQDAGTGLWQEQLMHVKNDIGFTKQPAYMTTLRFTDALGTPVISDKANPENGIFTLKTVAGSYVTINGKNYQLGTDNAVTIPTDINGKITILTKACDLYCPAIHLSGKGMDHSLEIHPNANLVQTLISQLGTLTLDTQTQRGTPVVSGQLTAEDLATLKTTIAPITSLIQEKLPSGYTHVKLISSRDQAMTAFPELSFDIVGDGLKYLGTIAKQTLNTIVKDTIHLTGDILIELSSTAKDIIHFAINVAGKIYKFVVNTLDSALKALSNLLLIIEADINKILDWIGAIFDWGNIQKTKQVLEQLVSNGLTYMSQSLVSNDDYKATIKATIDQLKNQPNLESVNSNSGKTNISELNTKHDALFGIMSNHQMEWVFYTIQHSVGKLIEKFIPQDIHHAITDISHQITKVVNLKEITLTLGISENTWQTIKNQFETIQKKMISLDFDIEWFINIFRFISNKIVNVAEAFAELLIQLTKSIADLIRKIINLEIKLPVLDGVFQAIGTGKPTIIGLIALFTAIPANEMSLTATGNLPFAEVEHIFESSDLFTSMIHWDKLNSLANSSNDQALKIYHASTSNIDENFSVHDIIHTYNKYAPKVGTIMGLIARGTSGQAKQTDLSFPLGVLSGPLKMGAALLSLTIPEGQDAGLKIPKFVGQICFKLTSEPVTDVLPTFASPLTSLGLTTLGNVLVLVTDTALAIKHTNESNAWKWSEVGLEAASALGSILVDSGSALNNIGQDTIEAAGIPAVLIALGTPIGQTGYVLRFVANTGTIICKQIG
ncbi:MAG: hypothetical protein AB8B72_11035 [Crocinitomicaceae bacterium]